MKMLPKLPQGVHPLRKVSLVVMFLMLGLALLKENMNQELIAEWIDLLNFSLIGLGLILFALLIIVKKVESNPIEELKDKQDKLRLFDEKAREISQEDEDSHKE